MLPLLFWSYVVLQAIQFVELLHTVQIGERIRNIYLCIPYSFAVLFALQLYIKHLLVFSKFTQEVSGTLFTAFLPFHSDTIISPTWSSFVAHLFSSSSKCLLRSPTSLKWSTISFTKLNLMDHRRSVASRVTLLFPCCSTLMTNA